MFLMLEPPPPPQAAAGAQAADAQAGKSDALFAPNLHGKASPGHLAVKSLLETLHHVYLPLLLFLFSEG